MNIKKLLLIFAFIFHWAVYSQTSNEYSEQGKAQAKLKDYTAALNSFNMAIAKDSSNANAYNNRGNIKEIQNDNQGAIADFSKAISIDSLNAYAYYNRARIEFNTDQYKKGFKR